jgi:Do/DeqQ family serine protease
MHQNMDNNNKKNVMNIKRFAGLFVMVVSAAILAVVVYARFFQPEARIVEVESTPAAIYASMPATEDGVTMDFREAAEATVHTVVHVKTKTYRDMEINPLYEFFFGIRPETDPRPILGYGSGVIISDDGYIVTNNHVIDGSEEIQVTLNDRRDFDAKLVGADPTTDLALLKIDEKGLPFISYGNSDQLQLGEWVLAVGNPYNLTSTVTAGIVSAKARDINILRDNFSIESFIQTDAAVNPGNSGGALVSSAGKLVGINTAIASRTGNYTGYSFAIPVSIVKKVVADLMEFGEVQRALLGVTITDITSGLAEEEGLDDTDGVFITQVTEDGAAKAAGMKSGDVVLSINDIRVGRASELQEQISRYRPNDRVKVMVKRDGKLKQFDVVLRNMNGDTDIVRSDAVLEVLGATFEPLSSADKRRFGIENGLRVTSLKPGKFMKVGIRKGFVVTSVNKTPVNTVREIVEVLRNVDGGVIIEGIYENGSKSYYAFGM